MLPPEQEELMALSGKALQTAQKTFGAINDADFKFGSILDSQGQPRELTHGSYAVYIRDRDRLLRENASSKCTTNISISKIRSANLSMDKSKHIFLMPKHVDIPPALKLLSS